MHVIERDAFLTGRYIATLATRNEDGSIHLTAVWYLFESETFYVPTGRATRKARNVAARAEASLMVDARGKGELRGIAATGVADLLTGGEALSMNARIHRRYLTEAGYEDARLGQPITAADDVTVCLRPQRWSEWDMNDYFGDLFAAPDLVYSLDG